MVLITLFLTSKSAAQAFRIAASANAKNLISKLQEDFHKRTGIDSEAVLGSSGKLTTQILNGAPFDIFLSADNEFPDKLYHAGIGMVHPKVYALGSLIICSLDIDNVGNWHNLIRSGKISKIAIANPSLAPYGKAALESLAYVNLVKATSSRLVFGESISQVNTYINSRSVDIGFTNESILYGQPPAGLKWARIDPRYYSPILQSAILIFHDRKSNKSARKFYEYLSSVPAKKIISENGYKLPKAN